MYLFPGSYKNFEDLESSLALKELELMLETAREQQQMQRKFLAAIQGIDMDKDNEAQSEFNRVKEKALANATGKSVDEVALDGLIDFVDEDELE